ncbi:hypothetical protein [Streptomyces sp. NBC_01296]|uniref:hypothetical protein n=1 Tax=Streptomyces sp. NBC_01296 TaxID=2903816 RepID=UPI002E10C7DD|nr:hypothetical protein OG299_42360 [Streptomyces sp. NBC_01296]
MELKNGDSTDDSGRYQLSYDAAEHALSQQDGTLGNLRNRATGLVTISTVIGTFTGLFGVGTKENPLPVGYAVGLIAFVVLIVGAIMYVVFPKKDWWFGPDPQDILDGVEVEKDRLLWSQAKGMAKAVRDNGKEIDKRAKIYGVAVVLLGLEAVYAVIISLVSVGSK